jgi:hypothetical protein
MVSQLLRPALLRWDGRSNGRRWRGRDGNGGCREYFGSDVKYYSNGFGFTTIQARDIGSFD